jgi:hypothetical protein
MDAWHRHQLANQQLAAALRFVEIFPVVAMTVKQYIAEIAHSHMHAIKILIPALAQKKQPVTPVKFADKFLMAAADL